MRLVEWTDEVGYRHLAWLRDRDPDQDAPQGLPHDPPDVRPLELDDKQAKKLHNLLVEKRLVVWHNSTYFKNGLNQAARAVGLDEAGRVALYRLYTHGPPRPPVLDFNIDRALDELPCTEQQRECLRKTFAQAGIRDRAGVENAPTRVGHACGLDIYQVMAYLLGSPD